MAKLPGRRCGNRLDCGRASESPDSRLGRGHRFGRQPIGFLGEQAIAPSSTADKRHRFEFLTGFEGTYIFGSQYDVLETTEHTLRYGDDLDMLVRDGVRTFRACVPWHRVEAVEGVYDWRWLDGYLAAVRERGLDPIVDPLHHTSFPLWMQLGFADPRFEERYLAFLRAFAERYPWVKQYTIINEPLVTAWFCGHCGVWQPRLTGHSNFVPMILAVCRTIVRATRMIGEMIPGARFVHVDSCERHFGLDEESLAFAWFENERRFLVLDLILGLVDEDHPLRAYLTDNGAGAAELSWFEDNAVRVDVLGLDYYSHSELAWRDGGAVRDWVHPVQGFAATAMEYVRRYKLPVMLTETNLRGEVTDRIGWLKYMLAECESLAAKLAPLGVPFLGFCWYPFIDSTDWSSLVCEARREIDPQGIYSLTPSFDRQGSELSELFAALVSGKAGWSDIPAYPFSEEALTERRVQNFLPHMTWPLVEENDDLPMTA
jgi:beta-glucosidase/6-phospho-beta-glucosidase/beta-galactosidase